MPRVSGRNDNQQGFSPDEKLGKGHPAQKVQNCQLCTSPHHFPRRSHSGASRRKTRTQVPPGTRPRSRALAPRGPQLPCHQLRETRRAGSSPPTGKHPRKNVTGAALSAPAAQAGRRGRGTSGPGEGREDARGPHAARSRAPRPSIGRGKPASGRAPQSTAPRRRRPPPAEQLGRGAGGGAAGRGPPPARKVTARRLRRRGRPGRGHGGKFNFPRLQPSPRRGERALGGPPHPHRAARPTPPVRVPPPGSCSPRSPEARRTGRRAARSPARHRRGGGR